MLGDESWWCVKWNNHIYRRGLTRQEAERVAEKLAARSTKNKDFGDHFEIFKDKDTLKEVNEMYRTAKQGDMQTYKYIQYR